MSRTISFIALALAAAAVAAPTALSVVDPNGRQAVDPLAVSYLRNQGMSPGEIKVVTQGIDPLAASYLRNQGFTDEQIYATATGQALQKPAPAIDPLAVSYLRNLGMNQAQIEEWTTGICAQANRPAVCSLPLADAGASLSVDDSSAGFSWSDAGIGAGATLGIVLLLAGLGGAFVISRQNRRRHVASA
jgi:hypothetical protein